MTDHDSPLDEERAQEEAWYRRAIDERFFEHEGFRRLVAWNVAALRRMVPLRADMRVLSIGSGLGDYELALAPDVAHITAVELSPTAAAHARARLARAGLRHVEVVTGPIDTQVFEPGAFDLVYAMGVFHHFVPDQRARLLTRLVPWLADDGWLYLRDPNARGWLRRAMDAWFRRGSDVHTTQELPLVPQTILDELRAAGLRDARLDYVDVIGGPLPWLVRSDSRWLWTLVFALDAAWLRVPVLRPGASQFAVAARR
jgi:SAM-dependent methyltransferase